MAESLAALRSRYEWDATALRYRGPRGAFVSAKAVKQAHTTYIRRSTREIERLATQAASGALPVDEWQRLTANLVKSVHLASAAVAKGGWAQMTPADFGRVGQGLRFHYGKLAKFAREIQTGRLNPGTVRQRAGMYAAAAGGVYENTRRRDAAGVFTEERNVLGKSEHCQVCKDQTARGWVAVGTLVPIGQRSCLTRCRCRYAFRAG